MLTESKQGDHVYIMPNTAIERMRTRYISELAASEARSNAIRAKLQVLDELSAEEKQIGSIESPSAIPNGPISATSVRRISLPSGLTDACRLIVEEFGADRGLSTRQVRDQLTVCGFPVKGRNFTNVVNVTLKRLARNKRILGEQNAGRWFYRANPEKILL